MCRSIFMCGCVRSGVCASVRLCEESLRVCVSVRLCKEGCVCECALCEEKVCASVHIV